LSFDVAVQNYCRSVVKTLYFGSHLFIGRWITEYTIIRPILPSVWQTSCLLSAYWSGHVLNNLSQNVALKFPNKFPLLPNYAKYLPLFLGGIYLHLHQLSSLGVRCLKQVMLTIIERRLAIVTEYRTTAGALASWMWFGLARWAVRRSSRNRRSWEGSSVDSSERTVGLSWTIASCRNRTYMAPPNGDFHLPSQTHLNIHPKNWDHTFEGSDLCMPTSS